MAQHKIYTVIEPKSKMALFNFKEIIRYKDLLYYMVLRDITVLYKQTVLGFAWALLNPLFQIVVFSLIFGKVAGIVPDDPRLPYPIFSCLGIIPWTYFSTSLMASSNSLITASAIFTKVYFPRAIIPVVPVLSKLVDFSISLSIVAAMMLFYGYKPSHNIWLFPLPLLIIIITSAGLGFWLSSLALQFRDFRFAIGFMIPILMYLAPVAYPALLVKQKFGIAAYHLYAAYPLVGGIEGFRSSFMSNKAFPWDIISISGFSAIIIFISGIIYFRKTEKHFTDVA